MQNRQHDQGSSPIVRQGGCACGRVRYELRGEPLCVSLCHCTDCRKASGSVFVTFGIWPWTTFQSEGEVGSWKGREFCPACGSQVFSRRPQKNEVEIRLGSLDEAPLSLVPGSEIWIKRRERWLAPVAHTAQYVEDAALPPPDAPDVHPH